nr:hypothetical protein CFP56_52162 [Quercus suber]
MVLPMRARHVAPRIALHRDTIPSPGPQQGIHTSRPRIPKLTHHNKPVTWTRDWCGGRSSARRLSGIARVARQRLRAETGCAGDAFEKRRRERRAEISQENRHVHGRGCGGRG